MTEYSPQAANASRSHNFDNAFYFVHQIIQFGGCTASACRRSRDGHPSQHKSHAFAWLLCWLGWPGSEPVVRTSASDANCAASLFPPRGFRRILPPSLLTDPLKPAKKSTLSGAFLLAGMAGFEPANNGVKVRCLTAWRHPNMLFVIISQSSAFAKRFPRWKAKIQLLFFAFMLQ